MLRCLAGTLASFGGFQDRSRQRYSRISIRAEGMDLLTAESRRVEANGLTFHVTDVGEGPPVLLLHGFPGTSDLWRNQIPVLVDAGYQCIAPDMRDRGRSNRLDSVSSYVLPKSGR